MSKRHKPQRPERPISAGTAQGSADGRARIESLLAAGKTRDAVDAAKERFKGTRDPEDEALLVEAYCAHTRTLMARGMREEARALAAMAAERYPRHRDRLRPLVRESALHAGGDVGPLLAELASAEGSLRSELEATLRRDLVDPSLVAEARALPEDHPLKQAARVVGEAFAAVTTGSLPEGALARLDSIPRHSVFAPWKLLIRAIDAFYRRADAAALANLAAIPADAAPARLVPVLRALLGASGADREQSLGATALLHRVSGGRALFHRHLGQLVEAFAARDEGRAVAAVQDLLAVLPLFPVAVRRSVLATILQHWLRSTLGPDALLELLLRARADTDTLRLLALGFERSASWDLALRAWDRYLGVASRTGALRPKGRELARVLLHMAELFPADPEELWDLVGVDSEEELLACVRSGELPAYFDRGALLERAREADAVPAVFRALVSHHAGARPRRAEAEADAWRAAHPRDLEPVLHLIRAAERRGALRKALDLLADAETINQVHPDVRRSRFRLLLASAERRLRDGKVGLALADLDRLEGEPGAGEGDTMVYLAALRWVAAVRRVQPPTAPEDSGDHAVVEIERRLLARAGNPTLAAMALEMVVTSFGLAPPASPQAYSQVEAVEALARLFDLCRAIERPPAAPPEQVARVERDVSPASAGQLHSLCAGGLASGRLSLAYVASGEGLARDGGLLHRFLLARGRVLAATGGEHEATRARRCLRAARAVAGRARDMEVVREASAALHAVPAPSAFDPFALDHAGEDGEPLAHEAIMRIVAEERRRRDLPRSVGGEAPRKRRRRRRRPRQHDLFGDLLAFLEKNL